MPNYCSWGKPAGWAGTNAQWSDFSGYSVSGLSNPATLFTQARPALTTPYYFDADQFGIVCASFPTAGGGSDPLISQASQIASINTTLATMQGTIASMLGGEGGTPWTTEDHRDAFLAVLGFLVVVWLGKQVWRFFWRGGSDAA
jgi:hypothetical protein